MCKDRQSRSYTQLRRSRQQTEHEQQGLPVGEAKGSSNSATTTVQNASGHWSTDTHKRDKTIDHASFTHWYCTAWSASSGSMSRLDPADSPCARRCARNSAFGNGVNRILLFVPVLCVVRILLKRSNITEFKGAPLNLSESEGHTNRTRSSLTLS